MVETRLGEYRSHFKDNDPLVRSERERNTLVQYINQQTIALLRVAGFNQGQSSSP